MEIDAQVILTLSAFFVLGGMLGFVLQAQKHADEVRQWQAIARKAQMLNSLANTLQREREGSGNGKR